MGKTSILHSRELRAQAHRRKLARKRVQAGLIGTGVLLLFVSAFWLVTSNKGNTLSDAAYRPEDVVYDTPLHAVHEMDGSKVNEIVFLPKDGPQPKIAFGEDFYSFGTIGATDVVTHTFVIFNQGDAPLTITRAYTSCGCTTADFTATVIPPGKVSIMTLTLDAGFHDVAGQTIRRGVMIESNDPNNPATELWTQANVANR